MIIVSAVGSKPEKLYHRSTVPFISLVPSKLWLLALAFPCPAGRTSSPEGSKELAAHGRKAVCAFPARPKAICRRAILKEGLDIKGSDGAR